ncbi:Alpha-L-rhamnosidase [Penicillium ucsense]|uniref:Alpha-L-rhamnosidase n=1 Tax=Penicillium ucsense TaxID=2839758 RepID=A0A8J8W026_9EURO|nr:Alpha-L-rhamnosidase [Penicillium ucsense]KAF7734412.1 Alpha-L-rhamnosidase [Penicillium ucsense]
MRSSELGLGLLAIGQAVAAALSPECQSLKAATGSDSRLGSANVSFPEYQPLMMTSDAKSKPKPIKPNKSFKLSSDGKTPGVVVLDYGKDVEGYATFHVTKRSGNTSVFEMSYSESRALLDEYMADGPLPLSAAMDTYRINRFNVTQSKTYRSRLIQGGLRYQKLNLSSAGELVLSSVGFLPSIDPISTFDLPGSFECSDTVLNRVWAAGARTVQLTEIVAKSLPDFWIITDEGALVDSLAPQPFAQDYASAMTAYDVDFAVKPISKGFGFTVLSDTLGTGIYLFVDVANGTISAHAGSTELDSPALASAALPISVTLNKWHDVHCVVNLTQISVEIDSLPVLKFSQTSSFYGSFGLGASYTHAAIFTNVSLTAFGQQMYHSSLTDKSALEDFQLGTNPLSVSVDGSRRDRIAYAGDLDIAAGATFASTHGLNHINGSIALLGSFQELPGFFVPTAKVQQPPRNSDIQANVTGLLGYSFSLASAMAQYYSHTGDTSFLKHWTPRVARLFDWADSQVLPNGLFNISSAMLGGDWNYYDPTLDGVVAKFNLIYAYSLAQWLPFMADCGLNATLYESRLDSLQSAINTHLWSESLQAFYLADSHKDFFSQEANALAILSGTTNTARSNTILSTMGRDLFVPAGALAFSNASASSGWAQKISPYASGYHLKAAFHANDTSTVKYLLNTLWEMMSDPKHTNYTGCVWETLNADGSPGLGDSTSFCHAWGAGPTADLSRYVLGVQTVTPGFKTWKVAPQSLDLRWARGAYPTPLGPIHVDWRFDPKGLLSMKVTAPADTQGTVYLPSKMIKPLKTCHVADGDMVSKICADSFAVHGGQTFTFKQLS